MARKESSDGKRRPRAGRNEYRCAIERNQNGKLNVRLLARFARNRWSLPVYFLASSPARAIAKLEQAVGFLQQNEEKLWFWSVDRSDDPNLADEMLAEAGLRLDRRKDFPKRAARLVVASGQAVPATQFAAVRRELATSACPPRIAAASD